MARIVLWLCGLMVVGVHCQCPVEDIPVLTEFDLHKFQGKWYEMYYKGKSFYSPEDYWQDVYHTYTLHQNGSFRIDIKARNPQTKRCFYIAGDLEPTSQPGKLKYTDIFRTVDYWILDTDYTGMVVVYGCDQIDSAGTCTARDKLDAWVFSRTKSLTPAQMSRASDLLKTACINITELEKPIQGRDCDEYYGTEDCSNGAGLQVPLTRKLQHIHADVMRLNGNNTTYSHRTKSCKDLFPLFHAVFLHFLCSRV